LVEKKANEREREKIILYLPYRVPVVCAANELSAEGRGRRKLGAMSQGVIEIIRNLSREFAVLGD